MVSQVPRYPEVAEVPQVSQVPQAPWVPQAPQVAGVPQVSQVPQAKQVSKVPLVSKTPPPNGATGMPRRNARWDCRRKCPCGPSGTSASGAGGRRRSCEFTGNPPRGRGHRSFCRGTLSGRNEHFVWTFVFFRREVLFFSRAISSAPVFFRRADFVGPILGFVGSFSGLVVQRGRWTNSSVKDSRERRGRRGGEGGGMEERGSRGGEGEGARGARGQRGPEKT